MYFITMVDKAETLDHSSRCFGYKDNFDDAQRCVIENCMDLHEYLYEYAVIEYIPTGIHPFREFEYWYKFNHDTKKFDPIKKPEAFKEICNFALG